MKRFFSCVLLAVAGATLLAPTTPSLAQDYGGIAPSSESAYWDCELHETLFNPLNIYILHMPGDQDVRGSAWRFSTPITEGWVYIGTTFYDGIHIAPNDNPFEGVEINYGQCGPPPLVIAQISVFPVATSPFCTEVSAVPHPAYGCIGALDCDNVLRETYGYVGTVNGDFSCQCAPLAEGPMATTTTSCVPIPVEHATWGGIKAMYRE